VIISAFKIADPNVGRGGLRDKSGQERPNEAKFHRRSEHQANFRNKHELTSR
jgi:hypothetical protein